MTMKPLMAAAGLLVALAPASYGEGWRDTYDGLLQKYVSGGGVKYRAWHANRSDVTALDEVVKSIGVESLGGQPEQERLAFYLNAYNAWILKRILDDFPTDGPGGGGFFGRNRFFKSESIRVAGKTTSFHRLEHEVIRPAFSEPRVHFALNCASASCPPLHGKAFRGASLDGTLDTLTKAFLDGDPNGVKVKGGVAYVSKIFDWFAEDFGGAKGIKAYIDPYRGTPLPAKIKYQDYSWELNETK